MINDCPRCPRLVCDVLFALALVSEQLWPSQGCTEEQDEKATAAQAYKCPLCSTRLVLLRAPYAESLMSPRRYTYGCGGNLLYLFFLETSTCVASVSDSPL
jgi:hypothetical protein